MELHPGETIIYEGHPSWRAILDFYLKGLGIALAVGAILWFAVSSTAGVGAFVAIEALAVLVGLI